MSEASGSPFPQFVLFELWYGVALSEASRRPAELIKLNGFLGSPFERIPFTEADAEIAGTIRAELRKGGTPIGAYDLLIAAQAIRNNMTLVTANVREFARVRNLQWINWDSVQKRRTRPNRAR